MSLEGLALAISFSAVFAYLTTRIAALVWGMPQISLRLRSFLELKTEPLRLNRPTFSLDLWVMIIILVLIEAASVRAMTDAFASGDSSYEAFLMGHWLFALGWLAYLWRVTPRRPTI